MKSFAEYITALNRLVKDNSELTEPEDRQFCLELAIDTYSKFRRRALVESYVSTGALMYSLPATWEEAISPSYYKVEYPVAEELPSFFENDATEIYNDAGTKKLRFRDSEQVVIPPSGAAFRLHYEVPHVLASGQTTTVPDSDYLAVLRLAAAELCSMIDVRLSQNADASSMNADTADYRNKSSSWESKARGFYNKAMEHLSPKEADQAPVMVFGKFIETPQRRQTRSIYPRDEAGYKYSNP